ncbi:hypothetical protein [Ferrimonas futtsuensis]|uniref:hypothetical protein n=1 Tax=Ferrimonas futtsuensis TaxID=364764 RepID=UPI0012FC4809|nr:hypothetical protein [Ferrimonas futtsuensis]
MTELNQFIREQSAFIHKLQEASLTGWLTPLGKPASWNDIGWEYHYPNGTKLTCYFCDHTVLVPRRTLCHQPDKLLPEAERHLLMAYAIELSATCVSHSNKQRKHTAARHWLGILGDNPARVGHGQLLQAYDLVLKSCKPKTRPLKFFIQWLKDNGLVPHTIPMPPQDYGEDNLLGDEAIDRLKRQRPRDQSLLALGAITHHTIPPDRDRWALHPLSLQRDALTCAIATLAMSSPNRVAAEQTVLAKQSLRCETRRNKSNKLQKVYSLVWSGSKGIGDFQNHILAEMAEGVARCLNYFAKACEPGRILARFYSSPSRPLRTLLGSYTPSGDLLSKLNLNPEQPINMFHLGYLLGFYSESEEVITINKSAQNPSPAPHEFSNKVQHENKPVWQLSTRDLIINDSHNISTLLGVKLSPKTLSSLLGIHSNSITVTELQSHWIEHIYHHLLPGFPIGRNRSKHNRIRYDQALFCLLGTQFYLNGKTAGNYPTCRSPYSLVPISAIGNHVSSSLSSMQRGKNIFERHGFDRSFGLTPHQFRHWLTDEADRRGVVQTINNLWGGRKNPDQLLHYVHTTHGEHVDKISEILLVDETVPEKDHINIRLATIDKYKTATMTQASITSTGICTQDLVTSPCDYLNDFETQCTLCSKCGTIKGDKLATDLLRKDEEVQKRRLKEVSCHPNFPASNSMQEWYRRHFVNTSILAELNSTIADPLITSGSLIRILPNKKEIRISDLVKRTIERRTLSLPCSKEALAAALDLHRLSPSEDNPMAGIQALLNKE